MGYGTIKVNNIEDSDGDTLDISEVRSEEATASEKGLLSASDKGKLDGLHDVASSGDYDDLTNKPTIPTIDADTVIDANYVATDENFTTADHSKLDGIEAGATGDQTGAEIKTAYESESDTNAFTDADHTKLDGIETGAQVNTVTSVNGSTGAVTVQGFSGDYDDLTNKPTIPTIDADTVIDASYVRTDENFTTADHSKLDGIAAGAEVNAVTSVNGSTGAVTVQGFSGDYDDLTNKPTLFSESYNDLTDKPTIPTAFSGDYDDLTNKPTLGTAAATASTAYATAAQGTLADSALQSHQDISSKADLVGGKLNTTQLPDIAVSEYKGAVANQTAMLAITGEKGDWVIRNDDSKVYVITGTDPSSAGDWTGLSYPAGFSGAYNDLTGKPTLGTAAATASTAYATAAQGTLAASAIQGGDLATVATSGSYADLSNKPTIPAAVTNNNQLTNGAGYVTSADGGNADTVDNLHAASFLRSDTSDTFTGTLSISGSINNASTAGNSGAILGNLEVGYGGPYNSISARSNSSLHLNYNSSGTVFVGASNTIWHAGNDGSGSGLDADLLDGQHGSYYSNYNNLSNKPTIPSAVTNNNQLTNGAGYYKSGDSPTFANAYTNGWWRNNDAGEGFYNQANDAHFYSAGANYWHLNGDSSNITSGGLILYDRYNASQGNATGRKGYLYWDSSGFGLLSNDGSWAYRHDNTNADIYGTIRQNGSNTVWHAGNDGSGSGLDADTLDGLQLGTGRNNSANQVVRTNSSGYIDAGWINTTSGSHSSTVTKVYSSYTTDGYIRYCTPNHLANSMTNVLHSDADDSFSGGLTSTSRDEGIFGTYDSTKTDHIWSMGTSYKNHSSGTNFGNLYGLAYKHTNNSTGGNMGGGHQMVWCNNGSARGAIGNDYVWHTSGMRVGSNAVWHAGNDGSGSGLDADTVDGIQGGNFLRSDTSDTASGEITFNGRVNVRDHMDFADMKFLYFGSDDDISMWFEDYYFKMALGSNATDFRILNGQQTRFTFNKNGVFTATSNITAYSDIRLKRNIEVIPNALEKVCSLRGVTYDRIDKEGEDDQRQSGVIAQEVEKVLPEVVRTNEEGIKSVAYGNMVGLLIESIKEQQNQIDILKQEIQQLRGAN